MTKETLYKLLGELDEQDIQKAWQSRQGEKSRWATWGGLAACVCFLFVGSFFFLSRPSDFSSMLERENADTLAYLTSLPVDGWTAQYEQVQISGDKLESYVGEEYYVAPAGIWYLPEGVTNRKYLIRREADGALTLWKFTSFEMKAGETYTYADVLSVIYGVDSAEDIVQITTSPFKANMTPEGIAIQKEIGTHTYTDRETISQIYEIVKDIVCYGAGEEYPEDDTRFSYSFSTEKKDKLTSGESTYGTRCIRIEFTDGTVLDSWKYSALSGSFFEYGGIFTQPLEAKDVEVLNRIFQIQ